MAASSHVRVTIDLRRIRRNAREIAARAGVLVWAVVKADAYGLGAARVAPAIADVVEGFCVFSLEEAVAARLWQSTGKPSLALGPPQTLDPAPWIAHHVRPSVSTVEQATALRAARPVLCVDTGMQRFACPPAQIDAVMRAGEIDEAFTHATRVEQAMRLVNIMSDRMVRLHAAATSLLDDPLARLDLVRPGLALYLGALRISAALIEARDSRGPVGYGGFAARRHGVILAGYAHGLRTGPCMIGGVARQILEVGMQSAYVELGENDRAGDEVLLLGDGVSEAALAGAWGCTPHEVLLRMAGMGELPIIAAP